MTIIFFNSWLNPIFIIGKSKSLELDDLYSIPNEDSSEFISNSLERFRIFYTFSLTSVYLKVKLFKTTENGRKS